MIILSAEILFKIVFLRKDLLYVLFAICQRSLHEVARTSVIGRFNRSENVDKKQGGLAYAEVENFPHYSVLCVIHSLIERVASPKRCFTLQKGGVPAAPSGTATLLRLSPNYQFCPRTLLAVTYFRHPRLSWLDGRCVQGPGTYSPRHG